MTNKKLIIEQLLSYDIDFASRQLLRLYEYQTTDEQQIENSVHQNKVGFNAADAPVLSLIAEAMRNGDRISAADQAEILSRMKKYAKQMVPLVRDEELI
jgi:hypothetical protein